MLWIWLDFLPQFADKGHDIAVVKGVFLCPYLCVYLLFGEYPALPPKVTRKIRFPVYGLGQTIT